MSGSVDQRVVELGFNNKQFQKGTEESMQSLQNMKKALDLTESARNIDNLGRAGKNFSLAHMGEGVQAISGRFSTLGIIGMTVIQNLTNSAIAYGKKMVAQLTGPMKEGFAEYETQMNAIQTVLANTESKGTTLEDVSAALDELNTYADKTIYNFTEMTRNIGTFTAAGVDLDTSTAAIKGIANLAAVSGSNSQQASTAMYQLSQALSAGTVKLMDWNSVVNAGMGGQVFQDALKETARVSGVAIDDLIDKHGSFRETLQTGWLSSEVLLDTLQKFTGDLSKEQLKTLGYTDEQIAGIIKLGQTANDAATKVKTFTQLKETLQEALQSGWTQTWQIILGDFEEAKAMFTEISDIAGAFIQANADARNALLQGWKDLGGRAVLLHTIRDAFHDLMDILKPISEAFRDVFPPITSERLFEITRAIGMLVVKFQVTEEMTDRIKRIFTGFFTGIKLGIDLFKSIAIGIFDFIKSLNALFQISSKLSGSDGILEWLAKLGDRITNFAKTVDFEKLSTSITQGLLQFTEKVIKFAGKVEKTLSKIKEYISEFFGDLDLSWFETFKNNLPAISESISVFAKSIKTALSDAKEAISGFFSGSGTEQTVDTGPSLFDPMMEKIKDFAEVVKEQFGEIDEILSDVTKSFPEKLSAMGDSIREGIGVMIDNLTKNLSFSDIFSGINAGLLAALILAIRRFLNSGSGVFDEMGGILEGVTDVLDGVRGSLEAWQQQLKAKTLLMIAGAIAIIAAALIALTFIDAEKLTISLGIITGLFANLMASMAVFSKFGTGGAGQAAALLIISFAILTLAGAMAKLAEIDEGAMSRSLQTIFALLAGLAVFSIAMAKTKGSVEKGALGILAFAYATLTLVETIKLLGKMDVGELRQGLIGLAALLLQIALFTKLVGKPEKLLGTAVAMAILGGVLLIFTKVIQEFGRMDPDELTQGLAGMAGALLAIVGAIRLMPKSMPVTALGMIIVAGAMYILAEVLKSFSNMSWEEIAKGLGTLAGSLLILSVGLYAMSGTLLGSAALLIAAAALSIFVPILKSLGEMNLSEVATALLALAGTFAVIGIAGLLLTPVVPVLLGLGAAILLIGGGLALIGAGLLAFSTGLAALGAVGTAGALAIVGMITILLGLIPLIVEGIAGGILLFAQLIAEGTPTIAKAFTALLLAILQTIIDVVPKAVEAMGVVLDGLITVFTVYIPKFVAAMFDVLVAILEEIARNLPDIIQAGFDILLALLQGIADNIGDVVDTVVDIITEFIDAVADNLPDIIQSGVDLIIAFIDGMAIAIDNNTEPLLAALKRLGEAMIGGLVSAIENGYDTIKKALKGVIDRIIASILKLLESSSPSKVFMRIGESIPEGLIVGILALADKVVKAGEDVGQMAVDAMTNEYNNFDLDPDLDPTITPIVDMSAVEKADSLLQELFNSPSINLVPTAVQTSGISSNLYRDVNPQGNIINEGTNIKFEQNNYSPEALSAVEIYRQTKNQLFQLRKVAG